MTQIISQVETVADDVGLVDREHGVACQVWLVRHHSVTVNRDQLRCRGNEVGADLQRLLDRIRPAAPLIQPKAVVLDVKQNALPWDVEPISDEASSPDRQSGNFWPRKSRLKEGKEVRRKPESISALNGSYFSFGEASVELHARDQ